MDKLLVFTLIGLSTGAIYAVAASGLVLTYTTSGIFNLAHGATGMLAAFVYWQLRFDWDWPAPLALGTVLLVLCPLYGALVERFIMRGLQNTSDVVKLSVTVGLLAASIGLANWLWPSDSNREAYLGFFQGSTVEILGYNVSWHKIITFACAVGLAVSLRIALYRTRGGVAMRAVVDDRSLAELHGGSPNRVSMLSWAGSAALAGLAGILLAGEVQLNIEPLVLLVVNSYAAAIVGRLRSLPLTFVGALIIGLLDSYYVAYSGDSWFPKEVAGFSLTGLGGSLPLITLFVALILLPQTRLRAGVVRIREETRAPAWSTAVLGAALLVAFTVAISGMLTRSNTLLVIDGFLFAIAALSLVPLTGYAGQVSLAPLTFAGLGAIAMTKLPGDGSLLSLIGAVAIVAVVGAVVALPALRLSGIYLALATAAFAVLVSRLVFNQRQTFQAGNLDVPTLQVPFVEIDTPRARLIMLSVAFSVLGLGVIALRRSPFGRRLIALKDSPVAAATLGMNLTGVKVAAFAISAAIGACAGALAGDKVSPQDFDFTRGLPVVLLAVVGGVASVGGTFFGGMLLGANVAMAVLIPALANVAKVMPGVVGISLGRNPNGAASQIANSYRPLLGRWPLIGLAVAGGLVVWALTALDVVSHWSFVAGLTVWVLGVVPNLTAAATCRSTERRAAGSTVALIGLLGALLVDWGEFATTGWRVVVIAAIAGVTGALVRRLVAPAPRVAASSPDSAGLGRPFTDAELEAADRALGVIV